MKRQRLLVAALSALVLGSAALGNLACNPHHEGPAERAGKKIDRAADKAGAAAEHAGKEINHALPGD